MTVSASGVGTAPDLSRRCRVEVGGPVTPDNQGLTAHFLDEPGASRVKLIINESTEGIRAKFKLEWQLNNWTPNIGYVELYGLNAADRKFCASKGNVVVVLVGSQLLRVGTISVMQSSSKHDGADWITKLEGGDGGRSFGSRVSASYAAGTPYDKIAGDFAKGLGKLGVGSANTIKTASAGKVMRNGFAVSGKSAREFKHLLLDMGLEYTIQHEEIIVYPRNGTTQEVFLLSPESGLVGSPEAASPPNPGKPQQIKARSMLNPLLRPASTIVLQSANYSGRYRCMTVAHVGDNYQGDWYTDLTLQQIGGTP